MPASFLNLKHQGHFPGLQELVTRSVFSCSPSISALFLFFKKETTILLPIYDPLQFLLITLLIMHDLNWKIFIMCRVFIFFLVLFAFDNAPTSPKPLLSLFWSYQTMYINF